MENKNPNREHEVDKGIELIKKQKFEEAIEIFDKYLEIDPVNLDAWYFKATALHNLNQFEDEILCYDKIMEIEPSTAAWYNKGFALGILGKYEEAIECYKKVLELNPEDAEAWLNQGLAFYNLQKFEETLECYTKITDLYPEHKEAWYRKGMTAGVLKRFEEAIRYHEKALEVDPNFINALFSKGMVLEMLGKHSEAIIYYDKTLEIDSTFIHAWYRKGIALVGLGDYEEAIKCMKAALEIDPYFEEARHQIDTIKGFLESPQERIPRVIMRDDVEKEINEIEGNFFENPEEIIRTCENALKKNPKDKVEWLCKGRALYELKEFEEALKCFEKALEIDPSFKEARVQKQIIEKGKKEGLQMIQLDLSRIEETDEGFIYEDKEGKLWKLHFDKSDENKE